MLQPLGKRSHLQEVLSFRSSMYDVNRTAWPRNNENKHELCPVYMHGGEMVVMGKYEICHQSTVCKSLFRTHSSVSEVAAVQTVLHQECQTVAFLLVQSAAPLQ